MVGIWLLPFVGLPNLAYRSWPQRERFAPFCRSWLDRHVNQAFGVTSLAFVLLHPRRKRTPRVYFDVRHFSAIKLLTDWVF